MRVFGRECYVIARDALPIGYYVYALIDPDDGRPFYVGKGVRGRCFDHLREYRTGKPINGTKHEIIAEIVGAGAEPLAVCIQDGMTSPAALKLERSIIHAHIDELSNKMPGQSSSAERALAIGAATRRRMLNPIEFVAKYPDFTFEDVELYCDIWIGLDQADAMARRLLSDPVYAEETRQRRLKRAARSREFRAEMRSWYDRHPNELTEAARKHLYP